MPFDGENYNKPFVYADATPRERLQELARLLENEQEWRNKTMKWDYSELLDTKTNARCGSVGCAMGLAEVTWGLPSNVDLAVEFGMCEILELGAGNIFTNTTDTYDKIFYGHNLWTTYRRHNMERVTPGQVAGAIRLYLDKGEAAFAGPDED